MGIEVDLSAIQSKSDLVKVLTTELNIEKSIASWMTTNLRRKSSEEGSDDSDRYNFEFTFDLDVAIDVLDDFPKQDFMKMVKDCSSYNKTYIVMAGKNSGWTREILSKLQNISELRLVSLPKAGHWVHVDD